MSSASRTTQEHKTPESNKSVFVLHPRSRGTPPTLETPPAKARAVATIVLPHHAGSQGRGPHIVHRGLSSPHFGVGSPLPSRSWAHIAGLWALSRLRRHPRQRPDLAELLPHLPPRVPSVVAHKQLAVEGAGQYQGGVGGMGRDADDVAVRLTG